MSRLASLLPLIALPLLGAAAGLSPAQGWAQDRSAAPVLNTYGIPGLIDMPSALSRSDGELAAITSYFADQSRSVLTFQLSPRLSASFRYARLQGVAPNADGVVVDERLDRSFSLHYRLLGEAGRVPALAVGINDLIGTGLYNGEYLVASKHIGPRVAVSAGLGWGRLGRVGSFGNPLGVLGEDREERPIRPSTPGGGQVELDQLFRGPAALFGGVEWQATDRLRLVAEYSSDDYPFEDPSAFERRSPANVGLSYAVTDRLAAHASWLYGSELGVQLTYAFDPAAPPNGSGLDDAPPPVRPVAGLGRQADPAFGTARALEAEGLALHGLAISGGTARVEIENPTYPAAAQAVGRTARVLTATLPPGVRRFEVVLVERGLPVTTATLERADLEALEFDLDGAWASLARARLGDAPGPVAPLPGLFPRLDGALEPYVSPSFFDPDAPLRADLGLDLTASLEPAPGVILSGALRQRLLGNLGEADRPSTSPLPRVRSESNIYGAADSPTVPRLTAAWYLHLAPGLYGRATAGYLEPQFGGLSTELLWAPGDSRLAYGAEVNYAVQRDFDGRFGLRDYDVGTGHASAYWEAGGGTVAQIDAGRYLAGDWGATLALDRTFENGWRVGAFATLTDVPFDEFGEGSFDKGIRLTVPLGYLTGRPSRDATELAIRPVLRDGGARLAVDGRLYDAVRGARETELRDSWGRFWR